MPTTRTEEELLTDVRAMIIAADKVVTVGEVSRQLKISRDLAVDLLSKANSETAADDSDDEGDDADPEWGTEDHAQVFMLGRMIEAAKKRFTHLAEPWSKLSEREQERVLTGLADDMRTVAKAALRTAVKQLVAERDALRAALTHVTESLDRLGDQSDGEVSPRVWTKYECQAGIDAARAAMQQDHFPDAGNMVQPTERAQDGPKP